jgi:hypothetical protein
VLAILAGGFAYSMKVETKLARNANYETELEWLGRSGVEMARWILAQSFIDEPYDSLHQKWAGGPGSLGNSNSPLAEVSLENNQLGAGTFSIKITDLERKFNVNLADEAVLQQALILIGVDAGELPTIVSSILDWIDRDDDTHIGGTESDYYEGLTPPYYAKNGPIDDLSELLLVHGVTPEIYWGSGLANHTPAAFQVQYNPFSRSEMPFYSIGLVDIFTPISNGRININTVPETTLQLIPMIDPTVAANIVQLREDWPAGLHGLSIGDLLVNAGLSHEAARQFLRFFVMRSSTFEVQVDAEISGYKRQFIAILGRNNQRDVQVLSFYWK